VTITPKILEYNNFVDIGDQEKLIQYFCHPRFRWALSMDAVKGVDQLIHLQDDSIAGMFHTLVYDGNICSEDFYSLNWILGYFTNINIDVSKLFRMRVGMFFKHPSALPHEPHVDAKVPHKTAVYYVNNCDGDFYLYQETYESHLFRKPEKFQLIEKAKPSKGKLILFDGAHFHASSYPNHSCLRLAITFNFYD
jgi:hypothetical protein